MLLNYFMNVEIKIFFSDHYKFKIVVFILV
jgi:hypothetical protein